MNLELDLTVNAPRSLVMKTLSDLETYPQWLGLVSEAQSDSQDPDAYHVTIKAELGPVSRSKKLRMVRSALELDNDVISKICFYRQENHGRDVANWNMEIVSDSPDSSGSTDLNIGLSYDGDLWNPILETIVKSQATKTAKNLERYIKETT